MSTNRLISACKAPIETGWVGWEVSHFFIVCGTRSTFPQVVGWFGREFFCTMPRRRNSASNPVRPPATPALASRTV